MTEEEIRRAIDREHTRLNDRVETLTRELKTARADLMIRVTEIEALREQLAEERRGRITAQREIAQRCADLLNEAFGSDPVACHALIVNRVPCHQGLADHPSIIVDELGEGSGRWVVGLLGFLNGLCPDPSSRVAGVFAEETRTLLGFDVVTIDAQPADAAEPETPRVNYRPVYTDRTRVPVQEQAVKCPDHRRCDAPVIAGPLGYLGMSGVLPTSSLAQGAMREFDGLRD